VRYENSSLIQQTNFNKISKRPENSRNIEKIFFFNISIKKLYQDQNETFSSNRMDLFR